MMDAITHGFGCIALVLIITIISAIFLIGIDTLYQEFRRWWKHHRGE